MMHDLIAKLFVYIQLSPKFFTATMTIYNYINDREVGSGHGK